MSVTDDALGLGAPGNPGEDEHDATVREEVQDTDTSETETKEETLTVYNRNDGVFGRDGGPYLDQEQERIEEARRAWVEGREPDFEHLPPGTGTQIVTGPQLIQDFNNTALAGQDKLQFEGGIKAPEKAIAVVSVPVTESKDETGEFTPVNSAPESGSALV